MIIIPNINIENSARHYVFVKPTRLSINDLTITDKEITAFKIGYKYCEALIRIYNGKSHSFSIVDPVADMIIPETNVVLDKLILGL